MRRLVKALLGLAVFAAALGVAATFLDTTERPPEFDPPGFSVVSLDAPDRSAPVRLHIWYPTQSDVPPTLIGQNGLFYGSHVRRDADPAPGPLPVVLLSHGSGGNAERLGWLAGYLAQRGMIVAAPNHPGTTSGDSDPFRTPRIWERAGDLRAALDLLETAAPMGVQPDMGRVAVVGFSLGGQTALAVSGLRVTKAGFIDHCSRTPDAADCAWMVAAGVDFTAIDAARYDADLGDARVRATVAIDPALLSAVAPDAAADVTHPVMLINLGEAGALEPAMDARPLSQVLPMAQMVHVPGARHFSFLAECSTLGKIIIAVAGEDDICSDRGLRDRALVQSDLREIIGGFLDTHLTPPR